MAATIRITRDLDIAEECVQDAFARALATWSQQGIPTSPGAWLTTVARRRAIDIGRRRDVAVRSQHFLVIDDTVVDPETPDGEFEDDRLRLIFTCCHPSLATDTQVALALRMLCGLSTAEVAKAFLVKESAMAARITRAKKKITLARIPTGSRTFRTAWPHRRGALGNSPSVHDRAHGARRCEPLPGRPRRTSARLSAHGARPVARRRRSDGSAGFDSAHRFAPGCSGEPAGRVPQARRSGPV